MIRCFVALKLITQHLSTLRRIPEAEEADMAGMDEIIRMLIEMRESAVKEQEDNCICMEAMQEDNCICIEIM